MELLVTHNNTGNNLTLLIYSKFTLNCIVIKITVLSFNYIYQQNVLTNHISKTHGEQNVALNNQQWLICHKNTIHTI